MLRIPSFVWGLSVFRCVMHILPSSFNASLMSRIRILQAHATYNNWKTTRPLTCMPYLLPYSVCILQRVFSENAMQQSYFTTPWCDSRNKTW
jgi:hypothetical protein